MFKLLISLILVPYVVFADDSVLAKKLVINEIQKYSSSYGVLQILNIKNDGVKNKKYLFSVEYIKDFCWDTGDDQRMTCASFKCVSTASVDSDAVVDFETEANLNKCIEVLGTQRTEGY